jgi:hypothetical protein
LLLLFDEHREVFIEFLEHGGLDVGTLMTDDDVYLLRGESGGGFRNVVDERASVETMKNFREIGTHARAESRGEDQNVQHFMLVLNIFHKTSSSTTYANGNSKLF